MLNENLRNEMFETLVNGMYLEKQGNGYVYEIEYDYDEYLDEALIRNTVENSYSYDEYISRLEDEVMENNSYYSMFIDYLESKYSVEEIEEAFGDELIDFLMDNITLDYNIEALLAKSPIELDIQLVIPKNNSNYIEDNFYNIIEEISDPTMDNILTWLCREQGYEFNRTNIEYTKSKFLASLREEIEDYCSVDYLVGALTIPVEVDASTYGRIIFREFSTITVPANFHDVGIMDTIHGGGSGMSICLEKPLTIPREMIGIGGDYKFSDVYGAYVEDVDLKIK